MRTSSILPFMQDGWRRPLQPPPQRPMFKPALAVAFSLEVSPLKMRVKAEPSTLYST